jgi:hypothetical protein
MSDVFEQLHKLVNGLENDEYATVMAGQEIAESYFGIKFSEMPKSESWGALWVGILTHVTDEALNRSQHLSDDDKRVLHAKMCELLIIADGVFHGDAKTCTKRDAFRLMQAAYFVGVFAKPQETIVNLEKASVARKANSDKASRRRESRREIIKAEYKDKFSNVKASSASAKRIIKKCSPAWQEAGIKIPKERTVIGDISAILEELHRTSSA